MFRLHCMRYFNASCFHFRHCCKNYDFKCFVMALLVEHFWTTYYQHTKHGRLLLAFGEWVITLQSFIKCFIFIFSSRFFASDLLCMLKGASLNTSSSTEHKAVDTLTSKQQVIRLLLTYSVALVLKRTIPTERPPLVGKVIANFCG
jgi:hypothetical protein